jgi:hypothetical protein
MYYIHVKVESKAILSMPKQQMGKHIILVLNDQIDA